MYNIGLKIKELRKKNDLTQEKLADFLGVTYQCVSKWESGTEYYTCPVLCGYSEVHTDERTNDWSVVGDVKRFTEDSIFAPLRDRDDFKALLQS